MPPWQKANLQKQLLCCHDSIIIIGVSLWNWVCLKQKTDQFQGLLLWSFLWSEMHVMFPWCLPWVAHSGGTIPFPLKQNYYHCFTYKMGEYFYKYAESYDQNFQLLLWLLVAYLAHTVSRKHWLRGCNLDGLEVKNVSSFLVCVNAVSAEFSPQARRAAEGACPLAFVFQAPMSVWHACFQYSSWALSWSSSL